jgi:PhnB protein
MTKLNPYLNFKSGAQEAMEFYKTVFGGNLTMSTFKESGMPDEEGLMHSEVITDKGFTIMGSDTPSHMVATPGKIGNISLSGGAEDETELKGYWEKLSEGANITAPLDKAPWGDTFGMLTDKFGIEWMVNIAGKKAE